jgi:hypothetical protein
VSDWEPTVKRLGDPLTPGRIGHVFFFPKESLTQLKGKTKDWGIDTIYGRAPKTSYSGGTSSRKL